MSKPVADKPADSASIRSYLETSKRNAESWALELKRRHRALNETDIGRPTYDTPEVPEAMRRFHLDGSWCVRGWPCEKRHLRGRPGDPEPSPVDPEVAACVGLPTSPTETSDGLFVQTVYGVGCFVMERSSDGVDSEIVGPYASGVRCESIIDGIRVARRLLLLREGVSYEPSPARAVEDPERLREPDGGITAAVRAAVPDIDDEV